MPILIINMGGEMVYILEQRLHAQNVPVDKSKRGRRRPIPGSAMRARLTVVHAARAVLQDVIRTMYNPKFLTELFRSQDVYSLASTRQIFDRLAHSSIMRLNQSSMDKLFDLMTMGFKYQLLVCTHPRELLHVTLNHLRQLRAKVRPPFHSRAPPCRAPEHTAANNNDRAAIHYILCVCILNLLQQIADCAAVP